MNLLLLLVLLQDPATRPRGEPQPQSSAPLIVPAAAKEAAGGTNNSIPFSWTPVRYQQWLDPDAFGFAGTLLLGGMSFRRDLTQAPTEGTVDLEIALATAPDGRLEPSKVFADNLGRDRQVVFPRQKVELRTSDERQETKEGKDPLDIWDLSFTFTRPFKYRTDRPLVFEVTAFGNDHGDAIFTFPLDAWTAAHTMRVYGQPDKKEGETGPQGLVVRFDVLARAAGAASRPASRPTGAGDRTPAPSR